jgi:hypothetical protein
MSIIPPALDKKDPEDPSTTSIEWDEMIDTWMMAETVLGSTSTH